MAIIEKQNFIFTGLQSWDIQCGSNAKDIALRVSMDNKVLYVNTPLDLKTYYKKDNVNENVVRRLVIDKKRPFLNKINENLYTLDIPFTILPINEVPDGALYDFLNKMNNKKVYSFINKIKKELGFDDHILFIDNDIYRSLHAKELLDSKISVYYRRDNLRSPFWAKHAERLESQICKKSDLVLTNSEELGVFAKKTQKNTFCVGQGVDLSNYSHKIKYERPSDIINIAKPIIGYAGMMTTKRLDLVLLYELAVYFEKINFVFIGPEDEDFKNHKIHSLKNVHFLGNKDMKLVPNYISEFDICINPQVVNEATIGNYPRKIDEYLSLGKTVIATETETMHMFKDFCTICKNKEEYIAAIDKLINTAVTPEIENARIDFANSHSWERSVEEIYKNIKNNLK